MDGGSWFKPKALGYGATPVTWEGWAVVAAYFVVVTAITILMVRRKGFTAWAPWVVAMVVATSALTWVSWAKTDGSWQWRWGQIENSGKAS
jgi:hypothetical protein